MLTEAVLQAGAVLYRSPSARRVARPVQPDVHHVVCLGDSFTYGTGAPIGAGYPESLQRALAARGAPGVQTVNFGAPGRNSSGLVMRLREAWPQLRPQALVVLAGFNNLWNFSERSVPTASAPWLLKAERLATRSRTVQFLRLLSLALATRRGPPPERLLDIVRGGAVPVERALREAQQQPPGPVRDVILGGLYLRARRPEDAEAAFSRAVASELGDRAYVGLAIARLSAARSDGVEDFLAEALRRNPRSQDAHLLRGLLALAPGQEHERQEDLMSISQLEQWLRHDLAQMLAMSRDRGSRTLFLTYPNVHPRMGQISAIIRRAGADWDVPVVDVAALFERSPEGGQRFLARDRFHLNGAGYQVLAEAVAEALLAR